MLALVVPFGGEAFFKELICKDANLRKPIHPFLNLNVYPSFGSDNVTKVVVEDNFVGDDFKMEMHVFRVWHGGVEVEVEFGEVDAQNLWPQGTHGGIDKKFGCGEISHWCDFVAWIVDATAANGEPNAMFLCFL